MTTETPKLCPFRFMKALNSFDNIYESWHKADLDNFMCLQEKCALWIDSWENSVLGDGTRVGRCGLAREP